MRFRFTKMHGLGNDFVVIDAVSQKISITPERARKISDRNFGVGCDQILIVEAPRDPSCDFRYRIFNYDGTEVENCGNGARCFAVFVRQRGLTNKRKIKVQTNAGNMILHVHDDDLVTVDMGAPVLTPNDIPFNAENYQKEYSLKLQKSEISVGAVSMGNPHAVCVVDHLESFDVDSIGAEVEEHKDFPSKVNAGFMEVMSRDEIRLRVFERGVGETLACGTGACAAAVSGNLRGLLSSNITVHLPGGDLHIQWEGEGKSVFMTGPATTVFHGQIRL